jgi:hypothetical protein
MVQIVGARSTILDMKIEYSHALAHSKKTDQLLFLIYRKYASMASNIRYCVLLAII